MGKKELINVELILYTNLISNISFTATRTFDPCALFHDVIIELQLKIIVPQLHTYKTICTLRAGISF